MSPFWFPGWARREQTDEAWQSPRSLWSRPFSCHVLLEAFRRCFHCPEAQFGFRETFLVSFCTECTKSDFHIGLGSSSEEHSQATIYEHLLNSLMKLSEIHNMISHNFIEFQISL